MNSDNIQSIRRLLNLYYAGLTEPDQEQQLLDLLRQADELPADLKRERDIMEAILSTPPAPADLASQLADRIDTLAANTGKNRHHTLRILLTAAASVVLITCAFTALIHQDRKSPYELTDPTEASDVTRQAIQKVSEGINRSGLVIEDTPELMNRLSSDVELMEEQFNDSVDDTETAGAIAPDSSDKSCHDNSTTKGIRMLTL